MVRAVVFVYVLLAALATPALLFAAGGDPGATSGHAPAAPASETNPSTTTGTTSTTTPAQSAPAPAPPPPATPAPAPQPSAAAAPAPRRPATVVTAARPAKTRAVAHAAGSATISDFQFSPSTITVTAGDSVTWSNSGPSGHSATADDGSFDTGILSKGQSGSHTFTKPGTYAFHCTPHPFMTGKVIVTAASGGGGGSASSGGSGSASGTSSSGASAATGGSTTGTATSSGSGLPNTGADTGAVALLGAILLGGGIVLRRRIEDQR